MRKDFEEMRLDLERIGEDLKIKREDVEGILE